MKQQHGDAAKEPMIAQLVAWPLKVKGMEKTPLETQKDRAECLEETLKAGIPVAKIDKLRPYLERRMGISLTRSDELSATYLPPLKSSRSCRSCAASSRASS